MLRERIPRAMHNTFGLWKLEMLLDRHFGRLLARSCARQNAPHRDQTSNWTQLIMIEEPKLFLMVWSFILLLIYKSCFEDVFERQLNRVSFLLSRASSLSHFVPAGRHRELATVVAKLKRVPGTCIRIVSTNEQTEIKFPGIQTLYKKWWVLWYISYWRIIVLISP